MCRASPPPRSHLPDALAGPGHAGWLWAALAGAPTNPPHGPVCFAPPLQNVRIDPNSLSFNMWKEIPVPFYLSVYFFDVVNPDAVLLGQKPQVRERGPYVYR